MPRPRVNKSNTASRPMRNPLQVLDALPADEDRRRLCEKCLDDIAEAVTRSAPT
jgi:hypothetical protein